MTAVTSEALDDTLRSWPALTGQTPPLAIWCAAEDVETGDLCRRLAHECDAATGGQHSYDGVDPWSPVRRTDTEEN